MSPWLFSVYMGPMTKEVIMFPERMGLRFLEERREWRLSGIFYADDLVLCGELEEDLRVVVGHFVGV